MLKSNLKTDNIAEKELLNVKLYVIKEEIRKEEMFKTISKAQILPVIFLFILTIRSSLGECLRIREGEVFSTQMGFPRSLPKSFVSLLCHCYNHFPHQLY